ncbi:MAG: class I SAM-dependent methyltransferase, partial [Candidatus Hydrogenedentes bacterium]|nr:class I SAM-dependent methyltransferase [Candidatus Hydrogenedentota bacterium]
MIEAKTAQATESVADHYNELDRWYLAIWGEHVHHGLWLTGRETTEVATHKLVARLAERLSIGARTRICDIGCGYGGTARVLAREYGASVTGVTLSGAQYAYAVDAAAGDGDPQILLMDFMDND